MVNHCILLEKFDRSGVAANFVRLMESYLIGRQLTVKLGTTESDIFGVPQGSNLGPQLFFLFVNNVCFVMPQSCKTIYTDAFKSYSLVKSPDDCQLLQMFIDKFEDWC